MSLSDRSNSFYNNEDEIQSHVKILTNKLNEKFSSNENLIKNSDRADEAIRYHQFSIPINATDMANVNLHEWTSASAYGISMNQRYEVNLDDENWYIGETIVNYLLHGYTKYNLTVLVEVFICETERK